MGTIFFYGRQNLENTYNYFTFDWNRIFVISKATTFGLEKNVTTLFRPFPGSHLTHKMASRDFFKIKLFDFFLYTRMLTSFKTLSK